MKLPPKERGQKALGHRAAAWQLAQLVAYHAVGVAAMLSSVRLGLRIHSRAVAAAFGVIYALQVTRSFLLS